MLINFWKYQGAGNDFVMIDNRKPLFENISNDLVVQLCSRHFGIGSDGIVFLENSTEGDFNMNFFNPDGSQSFCGNGSRCTLAFANALGLPKKSRYKFEAIDGWHEGEITKDGFKIKMKDVQKVLKHKDFSFADTGSPHYMKYVNDVVRIEVKEEGAKIRYSDTYKKEGVNVNFIQVIGENHIKIRTYERGVEDETFACGTGATACALSYLNKGNDGQFLVKVDVKGGRLYIHATKKGNQFTDVWLEGPAIEVFKGSIDV